MQGYQPYPYSERGNYSFAKPTAWDRINRSLQPIFNAMATAPETQMKRKKESAETETSQLKLQQAQMEQAMMPFKMKVELGEKLDIPIGVNRHDFAPQVQPLFDMLTGGDSSATLNILSPSQKLAKRRRELEHEEMEFLENKWNLIESYGYMNNLTPEQKSYQKAYFIGHKGQLPGKEFAPQYDKIVNIKTGEQRNLEQGQPMPEGWRFYEKPTADENLALFEKKKQIEQKYQKPEKPTYDVIYNLANPNEQKYLSKGSSIPKGWQVLRGTDGKKRWGDVVPPPAGLRTEGAVQGNYTVGKIYTDAQGRKAKYLGPNKWQLQ